MPNPSEVHPEPLAVAREAQDDAPCNPAANPTLGDVVAARFGRRDLLKGLLGVAAIGATLGPQARAAARAVAPAGTTPADDAAARFPFPELTAAPDATIHVAEGHEAHVLVRWGDPVLPGAPAFDPQNQTPRPRRCSSATTTTSSAISRAPAAIPRPAACLS